MIDSSNLTVMQNPYENLKLNMLDSHLLSQKEIFDDYSSNIIYICAKV